MRKFIISIDAGTTSNRSILFDLNGKPIFSSQKEFNQYFPKSGWVEHNPEEIWKTTVKTLKDVIQKAKRLRGQILSIGITNQRENRRFDLSIFRHWFFMACGYGGFTN